MRIQANPSPARDAARRAGQVRPDAARPRDEGRRHRPPPPAARPATVASPAKAAEVAAAPETYGGAGSLLDAEA